MACFCGADASSIWIAQSGAEKENGRRVVVQTDSACQGSAPRGCRRSSSVGGRCAARRGAGGAPTGKSRKSKPQRGGGVSGGAHSLATRRAAEESNNLYSSRVDMMFSKISKMATA